MSSASASSIDPKEVEQFSRIAAEFVLIVFRINEHLGAIREQGRAQEQPRF